MNKAEINKTENKNWKKIKKSKELMFEQITNYTNESLAKQKTIRYRQITKVRMNRAGLGEWLHE